ncbi:MAG: DUF2231 domain-containing protein [Bacteroidota bacterium]|nr:DUF2231 domain-containing protein [Bacteroidota bacterium]
MISTSHLHPILVHFPIALIILGFIAEIVSIFFKKEVCLSKMGFYLLIIGTVSAFLALFTGALFTSEMSGAAGEIQETHELFAWISIGLLLVTSVLRVILLRKGNEQFNLKWAAFVVYGLATISVSITGFYGGTLVYNYMMPL